MATPRLLAAFLLVCLASGVAAQEATFTSAMPSPLKQAKVIEANVTTFEGEIEVTGCFDVIWESGAERSPGYFRVLFEPGKSSQEVLPHDSDRGVVQAIWLRNTDDAIRAFLSPAERDALASTGSRHATGLVTVILDSYQTGVDCDQRGYSARLVSVVGRPRNVVASAPVREQSAGC